MMKLIKYFFFTLLVIFLLLLAAPFLFKGKIVALIKEQANANVNANIAFNEDISLSLISSFPNLSLDIKDICVSGKEDFIGDTLYSARNTALTLDIMSVIKGDEIIIKKILLQEPRIKALILKDGRANWDITLPDTTAAEPADTSSSPFHMKLNKLEIQNGYVVYDDREGDMYSEIAGMNYEMEGDFSDVLFVLKNKASINSLTFIMEGIPYLNHVNATALANLDADMNAFSFQFKDNTFTLNDLKLGLNGSFAMPGNDMVMNLTWEAKEAAFKSFLSLIPAIYSKDFTDLQAKGTMAMDGFLKGTYNDKQMPAFGLNLLIENGYFKYPALPAAVENVNVNLAVKNPDGDLDHTVTNLSKLHLEMNGDPFDARLLSRTPMSDPYIDAMVKGIVKMDNISNLVPLPQGTTLKGILNADLSAKGNMSTLEKENYEAFEASGNMSLSNFYYASPDVPKPVDISKAAMAFSPRLIDLSAFDANIGNSDIHMNGKLSNFFPYYFGRGTLNGTLNFNSNTFDANEYLTEGADSATTTPEDTAALTVVEIPENINFTLNSHIGKLLYTNMEISEFAGAIHVANQQLTFRNLSLQTLGSTMKLNGYYETRNPRKPTVDMNFDILNLDIQKAFITFNTVKKLAPAAEHVFGSFSTSLNFKSALTQNMQPDYNTLFAKGQLQIPAAEIKDIEALNKIADLIRKPEYKQMGIYKTNIGYTVENGKITTTPFDVKMGKQTLNLSGYSSLDQSLHYTGKMNVPRKDLGEADKAVSSLLGQLNNAAGSDIKMNENLPLELGIGGTFTKPEITTNLSSLVKSETDNLKNQAKEEALRKKKELEAQAKAEADRLKKEAEAKAKAEADRLKKEAEAKAKAEADKLKKEAEAKAKSEAEKLKNKMNEEAKKKIKGLLK